MERNFNLWLSQFKESIADYKYYIDFDVVYQHVSDYEDGLNLLNGLRGKNGLDFDNKFISLVNEYGNKVLRCIPILLAKREYDIFCIDSNHQIKYNFFKVEQTPEEYLYFVKETGLYKLLSDKLTGNLIDYVYGVEAGLNSNGRKNRGGHLMEKLVESYIKKAGFIKNNTYFKEMYLSDLESKTGLDLSSLSNAGTTAKRFDYVIITDKCVYACECNFYASGGSKLSETARSYKTLALESKGITNFKFVWFTDGVGWTSARNNLKETFDVLNDIYCIKDLENNILGEF